MEIEGAFAIWSLSIAVTCYKLMGRFLNPKHLKINRVLYAHFLDHIFLSIQSLHLDNRTP